MNSNESTELSWLEHWCISVPIRIKPLTHLSQRDIWRFIHTKYVFLWQRNKSYGSNFDTVEVPRIWVARIEIKKNE